MPRKKTSSKTKKSDGRSTSAVSSSSSSSAVASTSVEQSVENAPEVEASVEVLAKEEEVPAKGEEMPTKVAVSVTEEQPKKAEKTPKSSASKKKKREPEADAMAAVRANVMLELTETLSTNIKPKFDDLEITSAETKFAQLVTNSRTSDVLGAVARTEKAGASDAQVEACPKGIALRKKISSTSTDGEESKGSSTDVSEKKVKKPKSKKPAKSVEPDVQCEKVPDVALQVYRSQQADFQKMLDLRSALSAELNFRLGISKGLKPINLAALNAKPGKEKATKSSPGIQLKSESEGDGAGKGRKTSGGKKTCFAPNTTGGPDDGGNCISEPLARGPLGGESLASLIGKRREELQRKKEEMGVTSPTKELLALKQENAALRERVVGLEGLLNKLAERVDSLELGGRAPAGGTAPAAAKKPEPKKEETKDEDDDDVDLFGSDNEEEDAAAAKVREDRLAAYAAKKGKKPALIAKSSILLDVKPWDDETDMKKMEDEVRKIETEGLLWGASKLVPLAYGIMKLTINCVIEDDKVSTDWLQEEIEKIEDYVQSTDIAAFNKI